MHIYDVKCISLLCILVLVYNYMGLIEPEIKHLLVLLCCVAALYM